MGIALDPPNLYWTKDLRDCVHVSDDVAPSAPGPADHWTKAHYQRRGVREILSAMGNFPVLRSDGARDDVGLRSRLRPTLGRPALWVAVLAAVIGPAWAADSDEELQKKLANPIADLVTVPFQWTTTFKSGPFDKPQHILNIQPVYPTKLGGGWLLVNRAIVPVISNPALVEGEDRKTGLGDITYEGFFVPPPGKGGLLWAVGPIVQLRTATDERLGAGKWSAGPAALVFAQPDPWAYGLLLTQLWSFAGDASRPDVNRTEIQPILSHRLDPRHSLALTGTSTVNWEEDRSSQRWTVPSASRTRSSPSLPDSFRSTTSWAAAGTWSTPTPRGLGSCASRSISCFRSRHGPRDPSA